MQKAMYRQMDINEREALIKRLAFQLDVLNSIIKGPYVSGSTMGLADATLFPTLTFCNFMLPQFFGWKPTFMGKQLQAYWETMQSDKEASQVSHPPIQCWLSCRQYRGNESAETDSIGSHCGQVARPKLDAMRDAAWQSSGLPQESLPSCLVHSRSSKRLRTSWRSGKSQGAGRSRESWRRWPRRVTHGRTKHISNLPVHMWRSF